MNIDLNGKNLKYAREAASDPLEGNVIINFDGNETVFSRAAVYSALRQLLDDKCIKLHSSIQQLATLVAAKPILRKRNMSGRFVKNSQPTK